MLSGKIGWCLGEVISWAIPTPLWSLPYNGLQFYNKIFAFNSKLKGKKFCSFIVKNVQLPKTVFVLGLVFGVLAS